MAQEPIEYDYVTPRKKHQRTKSASHAQPPKQVKIDLTPASYKKQPVNGIKEEKPEILKSSKIISKQSFLESDQKVCYTLEKKLETQPSFDVEMPMTSHKS